MARPFEHIIDEQDVYKCAECGIDLTTDSYLESTDFRGRTGTAWLFSRVYNVYEGIYDERMMTTGVHAIVDIHCNRCESNLGWKYLDATNSTQKYKQGKYILEKKLISGNIPDDYETSSEESG